MSTSTTPQPRGFRDRHPWYVASQWMVAGVLRALANVRVEGMERCPPTGPLILASNHLSYVDIPLIGTWAPRTTIFFSKQEVRRYPVIGWIGVQYGTIYVRRGESDRQAIREALTCLAAGQMLGVFPEGHRSEEHALITGQPGIALLAMRSGAKIWPVAVTGSQHVLKHVRPTVTLRGGEPFDPLEAARASFGEENPTHRQIADTVMQRIADLLPERYRGVYR
jgi:1-acyl-sn-glycerol-3-phosphate acyltransferase